MHPRVLGVPIWTDAADGVVRYADISPPGRRIVQKTVHTGNGKSPRCGLLLSECIGAYRAGEYNPGSDVRNSLISSGCIINGQVENSILFKKVFVGNNCVIKNSIILNDVYLGDNTHIENCIVESRDTIRANSYYCGEDSIKVVIEKNERYVL